MSKQLRLSAGFSILAMFALAITQGETTAVHVAPMETGATIEVAAPALPSLPAWASFIR